MVVLRIAFALDVPILNCADDMGFVSCAELKFDFVPAFRLKVLKKHIQPAPARLNAFLIT